MMTFLKMPFKRAQKKTISDAKRIFIDIVKKECFSCHKKFFRLK